MFCEFFRLGGCKWKIFNRRDYRLNDFGIARIIRFLLLIQGIRIDMVSLF